MSLLKIEYSERSRAAHPFIAVYAEQVAEQGGQVWRNVARQLVMESIQLLGQVCEGGIFPSHKLVDHDPD